MSDEEVFTGVHEVVIESPVCPDQTPGLVVKWRRRGDMWEGLVSHEVGNKITTEWLPALLMTPVHARTERSSAPSPDPVRPAIHRTPSFPATNGHDRLPV